MQVQRRPRALLICAWLAAVPALAGCDHQGRASEAPEVADQSAELATLRRENASLRTRIQNLEEQVRLLEQDDQWVAESRGYESISLGTDAGEIADTGEWEPSPEGGPRQLPVVKLTPKGRSIERRSPAAEPQPTAVQRGRASITLSPVPNSGYDDGDDGGGGEDDGAYWDAVEPASASAEPASYRLVGSKLVQATKTKPSRPAGQAGDRSSAVVRDYESAMDVYREGRYADAEQAFEAIVAAHPNHDYADNALYWQGEAAYDQAHYADALAAFTAVVERYGGGNKAPDALLKIGLCYGRLGDAANARDVLTQLIAAYPRAEASKIAKRKLADLDD